MEIGKINEFKVISETNTGHYIRLTDVDGDTHHDDKGIFMPHLLRDKERSLELKVGQTIEAFIYQNEDGSLQASQQLPYAEVDEFIVLKCVGIQEFGAFLEWGLEKDLLVHIKHQNEPMEEGEYYLVRICYDGRTGKIYGTTKFASILESMEFYFDEGDKVEIIPAEEHHLGYRCIVNRNFLGLIYHNEIFTEIDLDQAYEGYVKKIREDGLLDVSLQKHGSKRIVDSSSVILDALKKNGGSLDLHDKSSPEDIKKVLGMSKQTFKNTIGRLYKARKILISKSGIKVNKS